MPEDDDFPLDPVLRGASGHVSPPLQGAAQAPIPSSPSRNSDMDDSVPVQLHLFITRLRLIQFFQTPSQTPTPRKRVRAVSDSPPSSSKRVRSDGHGHGRKPSNGYALMAVSQSLEGIAAALAAESGGPSEVQRKRRQLKSFLLCLTSHARRNHASSVSFELTPGLPMLSW
jgi:hypothetical protein